MFLQKIEFKNSDKTLESEAKTLIERFRCSLINNGQILSENMLVKNGSDYTLYVATPHNNSLDERFDSVYVKRDREELSKFFTITVV